MTLSITVIIIIITCLVSFGAFSSQKMINDLIFYPPAITEKNQWYRFFSCGLIHADLAHLAFNMLSLYMFGEFVEEKFSTEVYADNGKMLYLVMYIAALFVCLLPTFFKHKNDYNYRSLGASGAVSAVVFAGMLLEPRVRVGLFFIPPIIPAYIFGPIYLLFSTLLQKRGGGNINHSAHIWGAVFGLAFVILACYFLKTDYQPVQEFIQKVRSDLGR